MTEPNAAMQINPATGIPWGFLQPDWKYQRLRMALLAIADGRPMLEAQKLAIAALASVEEDLADAER